MGGRKIRTQKGTFQMEKLLRLAFHGNLATTVDVEHLVDALKRELFTSRLKLTA